MFIYISRVIWLCGCRGTDVGLLPAYGCSSVMVFSDFGVLFNQKPLEFGFLFRLKISSVDYWFSLWIIVLTWILLEPESHCKTAYCKNVRTVLFGLFKPVNAKGLCCCLNCLLSRLQGLHGPSLVWFLMWFDVDYFLLLCCASLLTFIFSFLFICTYVSSRCILSSILQNQTV